MNNMSDSTAAVVTLVACALAFIIVALIYWKKFFSTIRGVCNYLFRTRLRNNHSRIINGNCEQDAEFSESHIAIVSPETCCGSCGSVAVAEPRCRCFSPSYSPFLEMRAQTVEDVVSPADCASQLPISRTESREAIDGSISLPEETGLIQKEDEEESPSVSPISIPVSTHRTVHIPYMAEGKEDVITRRLPKVVRVKMVDAHSELKLKSADPTEAILSSASPLPVVEWEVPAPERTGAIPKITTSQIASKENNQDVELSVSVPRIRRASLPREEFNDDEHPVSFLINTGAIRVKQAAAFTDVVRNEHNFEDREVGLVLKARDVSIDVPLEASLELEKARQRLHIKMNTTAVHQDESSVKIRNGFFSSLIQKKKMDPRRIGPSTSRLEIDGLFHTSNYQSYKKVVENQSIDLKENSIAPTELIDLPPERIEALRKKRLRNQTIHFGSVEDLVKEDERLQVACTSPGPSNSRGTIDQ